MSSAIEQDVPRCDDVTLNASATLLDDGIDPVTSLAHRDHHHFTGVSSGFPFSTMYVASSAPLPEPMFFTQ
jgi:hypothetical protein